MGSEQKAVWSGPRGAAHLDGVTGYRHFHAERSISALSACCAPGAGRSGRGRMSLADTPVCRDTGGHGLCGSGGGRPGEWGRTKDAGAQPRRPPRQRCPLCARHSVLWQWLLDSVLLSLAGPWDPLPPRRCWVGCQGQHGQLRQCPDPPVGLGFRPFLPWLAPPDPALAVVRRRGGFFPWCEPCVLRPRSHARVGARVLGDLLIRGQETEFCGRGGWGAPPPGSGPGDGISTRPALGRRCGRRCPAGRAALRCLGGGLGRRRPL